MPDVTARRSGMRGACSAKYSPAACSGVSAVLQYSDGGWRKRAAGRGAAAYAVTPVLILPFRYATPLPKMLRFVARASAALFVMLLAAAATDLIDDMPLLR